MATKRSSFKAALIAYVISSYVTGFMYLGYYNAKVPFNDPNYNPLITSAVLIAPIGVPLYVLTQLGRLLAKVEVAKEVAEPVKTMVCL